MLPQPNRITWTFPVTKHHILCFHLWLLCQQPAGATGVNNQVNNLLLTDTLVPVLTTGLPCGQLDFSCDTSHDHQGKTDGAVTAWESVIDFGFSQQSMFRSWHLCLNAAAPSITAQGRGRSRPGGGCESMQQNWINEAPLPKWARQRGKACKRQFFLSVAVVVSGLTVMDGADMSGWRKYCDSVRGRKSFDTTGDAHKGHSNGRKEEINNKNILKESWEAFSN